MQFGRVEGYLALDPEEGLRLTVVLDMRQHTVTVRDEVVPGALRGHDPAWLADQLVQDTLANELAEAGWEVIGESPQDDRPDAASALARSTSYIVRQV
jgi:hypothetical protein